MQPTKILLLTVFTVLAGVMAAGAAPIKFGELSLWVRARDTDQSILREVNQRKLAKALTAQEEATLKNQGASASLIQSLKSSAVVAPPADVAATEVKPATTRATAREEEDEESD